jgi:hypothetical protein
MLNITAPSVSRLSRKCWSLDPSRPYWPSQPATGIALDLQFWLAVVVVVIIKGTILQDTRPCSPLKVNGRFGLCLIPGFTRVSRLAYSSTLKMGTIQYSEGQVNYYQTTRCCAPEDYALIIIMSYFSKRYMEYV